MAAYNLDKVDYYYEAEYTNKEYEGDCDDLYEKFMRKKFFDDRIFRALQLENAQFANLLEKNMNSQGVPIMVGETMKDALERLYNKYNANDTNPFDYDLYHNIGDQYISDDLNTKLRLNCWRGAILEHILIDLNRNEFPIGMASEIENLFLFNNTLRIAINIKQYLKVLDEHEGKAGKNVNLMDYLDDIINYIFILEYVRFTTQLKDDKGKYVLIEDNKYYLDELLEEISFTKESSRTMLLEMQLWVKDCSYLQYLNVSELFGGKSTKAAE